MQRKEDSKYISRMVAILIIGVALILFVGPVWIWLQLNVKAIDVNYEGREEDAALFVYEGRTYREIDKWETSNMNYSDIEKERIGRAKGTCVVLYTIKSDSDKTIIVGETPMNEVVVYSYKFDVIPEDGTISGVYLSLGIPGVHGDGQMHLTIKKNGFVNEKSELFQRFWTKRYQNAPIEFVNPFSMENDAAVSCSFCFEGCPLPGTELYVVKQKDKWYFVETYYGRNDSGQSQMLHEGYLIDDSELIEYLNAFMQYEDAAEVQMQTEASEMSSPETEVPEPAAKVPEALKTLLSEHFLDGTIAETLEAMMSDVVVAKEEYEKYRGCGIDLDLSHLEEYGGVVLRVDADNDGIEDLFLWIDDGGSMGNSTFYLAKGKADGDYEITEYQETLSQEIAFVEFEGLNYLVETDYEYYRKAVNGFIVTCYEDGLVSDRICLEAVSPVWKPEIISYDSDYVKLAEQYAELGKDGFHDNNMYEYREDAGSGERLGESPDNPEETMYYSDINNDGIEEWYDKYVYYPSNLRTSIQLDNYLYFAEASDQPEYLTSYYDLQYEGTPLMFWVEQTTNEIGQVKQVVCLLTYEGLSTNRVYGYLIEGDTVTEVFELEYEGQLEFQYTTELEETAMKG